MAKIGKRTKAAIEGIDRKQLYAIADAVPMAKSRATAKFA